MQTKIILAITALVVVAAAFGAVAVIQFAGAQTQNGTAPQLVQLPNGQYAYGIPANANGVNGTLVYPCYPYGVIQNGTQTPSLIQQAPTPAYGYGYGRGMCGRFW